MNFEQCLHPEQAYNRCSGILRLARTHGAPRLEAACLRGLTTGAISYKSIKSILSTGLDRRPLPSASQNELRIVHSDIRGAEYYATAQGGGTNHANGTNDQWAEDSKITRYDPGAGISDENSGYGSAEL